MNRLAITKTIYKGRTFIAYIALDEKREFVDFSMYPDTPDRLLGSIFIGRVDRIVPDIGAAFVTISPDQKCFLPLGTLDNAVFTKRQSAQKAVCAGDELLVQVTKEAVKTKDPVASPHLTLAGAYSVLTTENTALAVSKRLPEETRVRLRTLLAECCPDHEAQRYGVVLRTNASFAAEEELKSDIGALVAEYRRICATSPRLTAHTAVYRPVPEYLRRLQTVRGGYDGILTDIPELYGQITEFLPYLKEQKLVRLYEDKQVSLQALYNIEGNIEKLLSNRVWLRSGANIIIEQLETMTVIDVNSSKSAGRFGRDREEMVLAVNKEAAAEVARQLMLRNISGMIVVDFINMESEDANAKLISFLKEELKKDVIPCRFIDMTGLGLIELTRKKVDKSLMECVNSCR